MFIVVLPNAYQCVMWEHNLFGKPSTNSPQVSVQCRPLGDLRRVTWGFHRQIPNPLSVWNPHWSCLDSSPFSEPQHHLAHLAFCSASPQSTPRGGTPGFLPGSPVTAQHQSPGTVLLSSVQPGERRPRQSPAGAAGGQLMRSPFWISRCAQGLPRSALQMYWTTVGRKILFSRSMFIIQHLCFHHFLNTNVLFKWKKPGAA